MSATVERPPGPVAGPADGPIEREVTGRAMRYAAPVRLGVALMCVPLAALAVPSDQLPATLAATVALVCWSGYLVRRGPAGVPARLIPADVAVLALVALTQVATVPAAPVAHGNTWVCLAVSIAAVSYQWHERPRKGLAVAAVLVVADGAGVVLARPDAWVGSMPTVGWILVEAALSAMALGLLYRGARAADRAIRRTAEARAAADLAQAREVAERAHLAALHDTACATLMMAAVAGERDVPMLRAQARRDLDSVRGGGPSAAGETDLAAALAAELDYLPGDVRVELDGPLPVPAAVAVALRQAAAEALRNVARHAGVRTARLRAARTPGGAVLVEISDDGVGFDPDRVPAHRRGLAHSVRDPVSTVGGRVVVRSSPGRGTTVRLEWPDAD